MGRLNDTRRKASRYPVWRRGQPDTGKRGDSRGVTFIELIIVLAVVGILSALALPAYDRHLLRARRSDAIVSLLEIASRQQQHFSRTLTYTDNVTNLGYPPDGNPHTTRSPEAHYRITLQVETDAQGVTWHATATPTGRQARDTHCAELVIHDSGRREAHDLPGRDTSRRCWGGRG
jgi:type IV pilus assembly protein PilE